MMIVMNNDTYKKLNPDQQKALDQAAKEASRFNDQLLTSITADIESSFAKMKVTKINNAPWREATKDVYKSFLKYDGFEVSLPGHPPGRRKVLIGSAGITIARELINRRHVSTGYPIRSSPP